MRAVQRLAVLGPDRIPHSSILCAQPLRPFLDSEIKKHQPSGIQRKGCEVAAIRGPTRAEQGTRFGNRGELMRGEIEDLDLQFPGVEPARQPSEGQPVAVGRPCGIHLMTAVVRQQFLGCTPLRRDQEYFPRLAKFCADVCDLFPVRRPNTRREFISG